MNEFNTSLQAVHQGYINLDEDDEVQRWSWELGLSPEELRQAVRTAGNRVDRVLQFLHLW